MRLRVILQFMLTLRHSSRKSYGSRKNSKSSIRHAGKGKAKKRDPSGWYMDKEVGKIPLDEYLKNDPPRTGPKRSDVLKKKGFFPYI
jgi:hypothetical protein